MKIFITGDTGLVGTPILEHVLKRRHSVRALARSPTSASKISVLGATPVRGTVSDTALLAAEAERSDAVIHCAYDLSTSSVISTSGVPHDATALAALCQGLAGSGRLLIYCSSLLWFGANDNAGENTPQKGWYRNPADRITSAYATQGVRPVQLRLAMVVHDKNAPHHFVQRLYQTTHVTYAGEGDNRWPAVHADDVAVLVGKLLEQEDKIPHGRVTAVHAYAEQVSTRELAEAIANQAGVPARSMGTEALKRKGPFLKHLLTASPDVRNTWTRETFGWEPKANTLLEDLEGGGWFLPDVKMARGTARGNQHCSIRVSWQG